MCIIIIAENKNIPQDLIQKAMITNPHGSGFGWHEKNKNYWQKKITTINEALEINEKLKPPYIFHARISTCSHSLSLTHPFIIAPHSPLTKKGSSLKPLFFHNGHIQNWLELTRTFFLFNNVKMPKGEWSDSRLLAFIIATKGKNIINLFEGKFLIFDKGHVKTYGKWEIHKEFWMSNTYGMIDTLFPTEWTQKDWSTRNTPTLRKEHNKSFETCTWCNTPLTNNRPCNCLSCNTYNTSDDIRKETNGSNINS